MCYEYEIEIGKTKSNLHSNIQILYRIYRPNIIMADNLTYRKPTRSVNGVRMQSFGCNTYVLDCEIWKNVILLRSISNRVMYLSERIKANSVQKRFKNQLLF